MSTKEKLIERFKKLPKDFTFDELVSLMTKNMGRLTYKGYTGSVEYDDSVNKLVGKVLGMKHSLILYEGDALDSLKKDFEEAVDDYIEECNANNIAPEKPFSGKTVIRMGTELHQAATLKAKDLGISLKDFIKRAIAAAV